MCLIITKLWEQEIFVQSIYDIQDKLDATTGETIQVEDEIVYIAPTKDGEMGTFTTEINLPSEPTMYMQKQKRKILYQHIR